MSVKSSLGPTSVPQLPQLVDKTQMEALEDTIRAHVSRRAYRLFELSGYQDGQDWSHWFQAETELLRNEFDLRESGNWLTMNAQLPVLGADNVQIGVAPDRVIVRARRMDHLVAEGVPATDQEIFLVTRLEQEVDPTTARASLRGQKLTIMAKKRFPETITSLLNACLERLNNWGVCWPTV